MNDLNLQFIRRGHSCARLARLILFASALGLIGGLRSFAAVMTLPPPAAATPPAAPIQAIQRERLLMDFGWKFYLGNEWGSAINLSKAGTGSGPASMSFGDASWRTVNLPHDWAVELPFDDTADGSHGFKAIGRGFPQNSVAWYRRSFDLPAADSGKRLWLEFDGVYRDCVVFVNGWLVGHHESGYSGFRYDITDVANCGGRNVVAVKVDASEFEGWFYEGAGIYRHVWLTKTDPLAVAPDGTFVSSSFKNNVLEGPAEIHVQTRVLNSHNAPTKAVVRWDVIGPDGKVAATAKASTDLAAHGEPEISHTMQLRTPVLWSPETPQLYKLVTTIESDNTAVDRTETEFGIRTVAFDVEKGFLLNGKPYVLKGTCNHQDHAGVGSALPDRLQYFRVARLKEMGDNAYRTSHNPPTPELLEACDHLGMLVMDENRLLGSDARNLERLEGLVRRDRNHPSVVIWSIANEEFSTQGTSAGKRTAGTMQDLVKRLDPTRPVTYAAPVGNDFSGINQIIEVRGWNYHVGKDMEAYHQVHPKQPNVGTEQASTVCTRGIYANDRRRGYVSAYDENAPPWAHTAETWWSYFATRPWLSGGFAWTGFDYRGEPTPYSWPCINSHFGILDTCGFPKDNFWYYQSWWTDRPVLHLLPHWNWPGKEGQDIDVRALSNCDEVELFLNGQSLGRKPMKKNSHLAWKVRYAPGVLSAKGYQAGKIVAEAQIETAGAPAALCLTPDRSTIHADGEDLSVITVSVQDDHGRIMPVASNLVRFELSGPARILGVGNGDPSCHESDQVLANWPIHVSRLDGWRWKEVADPQKAGLPELAAEFDDSTWASADTTSQTGPLTERQNAVFRAHFNVTDQQLAAEALQLCFGMIDEDGFVYVNGEKAGESHDWRTSPTFDIKRLLHAGSNSIAVAVGNYEGAGGINKGVTLQIQDKPITPPWQRSVFNGLAQIIVQSSKEAGDVRLTATSPGLRPVTQLIQAQACSPRACVP